MTPDQAYRLYIVKRTQVEMITDRGIGVPQEEIDLFLQGPLTDQVLKTFITTYSDRGSFSREKMSIIYQDQDGHLIYVYYAPSTTKDTQGVAVVNSFINTLNEEGAHLGIIISQEDFTSGGREALELLTKPIVQVFRDEQLYTNPTTHVLVPRHRRLDPESRRQFLIKNRLKINQILVISIDDPIVKYYGWGVGDLLEIERVNFSTNKTMVRKSLTYRMVGNTKFDALKKVAASAKVASSNEIGKREEK